MPELPEVETIRRGLAPLVIDRVVAGVDIRRERVARRQSGGSLELAQRLAGRRVNATGRRGKALWLSLDDGSFWVIHLGMSGQLRLGTRSPTGAEEVHAHVRARVTFADDEPVLEFHDQRTFGWMNVCGPAGADSGLPAIIEEVARDSLDPLFDSEAVVTRWSKSRSAIKRLLLDQKVISGIGNIYADEALWRVGVHWGTPADTLAEATASSLLRHIRELLVEAVEARGTSFDQLYVDVRGNAGRFGEQLCAYGREGQACRRCGAAIVRDRFDGRSSFRCPTCQPAARA